MNQPRRPRVLLIEDDPGDSRLIRETLLDAGADFELETVERLETGIARLEKDDIRIVLLDLGLPDSQGIDSVLRLRRERPAVPIVVLTGLADEELGLRAVHEGAQDYLVKGKADGRLVMRAIRYALERHETGRALKATVEELGRKTEDLEAFLYSASHDLKEPLRALGVFSQFLLEDYSDKLDDLGKDYLNRLVKASARMTQMVEDLLTLSRVGRQPESVEPVDVGEIAHEALTELHDEAARKNVRIEIEADMPVVLADPVRVGQVVGNLLSNAVKFTRTKRPRVKVGVRDVSRGTVTFYVRDNGIGIDPRYAERIFGLFQRLHKREDYPGTGAGLAIAKRAVGAYGGRIWVESWPNAGSTFYFSLPVDPKATAAARKRAA